MLQSLTVKDLRTEHQLSPLGLDIPNPRFSWKLESAESNTRQTAYRLELFRDGEPAADTGRIKTDASIENEIPGWSPEPMTRYDIRLTIWNNHGNAAGTESWFETGRLGVPFDTVWVEPEQEPTPSSLENRDFAAENIAANALAGARRDYAEFRPAQYLRIPFTLGPGLRSARLYITAHGLYRLTVNGVRPDGREFAPENTSYHKILLYQTYDLTPLLREGENVLGVILGDGWWAGRVGTTGDSCQYGDKLGLLLELRADYQDGHSQRVTGEEAFSHTGPILFSDLFVGEKYDARRELPGWDRPGFDQSGWLPVRKADYPMDNLTGQYAPPVLPLKRVVPARVFVSPAGETIIDAGQVVAGNVQFSLTAPAGRTITLEHSEVLDEQGNFFHNILGTNKEQTVTYITKEGFQTYRPTFSYHGFRYIRVTGWPGRLSPNDFVIYTYTSGMDDIGGFTTSDRRLNRLQQNIWWSQVANTISIPTDCPQREKAGWTGDIMAYAPTLCFNRDAGAFLTSWLRNLRADQLEDGAVPDVVPNLIAYQKFLTASFGSQTSCGWGDAVLTVPWAVYEAYGDRRVLEENYDAMRKWLSYIQSRCEESHPEGYENWPAERKARSRYLWNTDFHFGDWLIPSVVLGNADGGAMAETAFATMGVVAPAYAAFSSQMMAKIARTLGKTEDAAFYEDQYRQRREAFIAEYVHDDGSIEGDFQGIYVIALKVGLVPENLREKVTARLCEKIKENRGCLDTGFLSVLFLMDALTENGRKDVAYRLLFQTRCPSWLYEVEHGATTIWESWGAIGEDGSVSSYSYNHYAFGCIGEWLYREIGGLKLLEPGYKRFKAEPSLDCGLKSAAVREETPYGLAAVDWEIIEDMAVVHVTVPAGTTAEISLPGLEPETVGSGKYTFTCKVK